MPMEQNVKLLERNMKFFHKSFPLHDSSVYGDFLMC